MTRPSTSHARPAPVKLDPDKCAGCGACLNSCPTDVFRFDLESQKAVLAYAWDCSYCFLCIDDCPTSAIEVDSAISSPRRHSLYSNLTESELIYREAAAD